MRDEEPVRDIFQKTIVRQPFTLELYAQVHLLIATCARSCSENYRSSHLESRFGRTLRSQVFQTLTKARVYMTIISEARLIKRSIFHSRYNEKFVTSCAKSVSRHIRNVRPARFAIQQFLQPQRKRLLRFGAHIEERKGV